MAVEITRKSCGNGIMLTRIHDSKFKSFGVVVRLVVPMDIIQAPVYSLVLDVLATSTRKYPEKEQFSKALCELYSAGITSNAARLSDYYSLNLTLNCLCDDYTIDNEKVSYKACELLLDCLLDPYLENGFFSEKYLRLCRDDMLDDIDALINNKRRYASAIANKYIFAGEKSAISPYDYRESIMSVTAESALEAYKKMLRTAYIDIAVTGGNCSDDVIEMMLGRLASLDRDPISIDKYGLPSPLKSAVCRQEERINAKQCQLLMAYKTENYNEYASKLFVSMLGATPLSKLFLNVREKMSLCYYCDAMINDLKNTIVVGSGLDADNLSLAESAVNDQLKAMQNGEFSDEELENTKLYLKEAYLSNYDSKFDICTWMNYQFMRGSDDTPEKKGEKIAAVTREDIIREAKGYKLDTVFVLVPEDGGADDED